MNILQVHGDIVLRSILGLVSDTKGKGIMAVDYWVIHMIAM